MACTVPHQRADQRQHHWPRPLTDPLVVARPAIRPHLRHRDTLTEVDLVWIAGRLEQALRFGRIASERIVTPHHRIVAFRPGAVFAVVCRSMSDVGGIHAHAAIVRAVMPGEACATLPFVRPGGEVLLSMEGAPGVAQVLAAIADIEAAGLDPCDAAPEHWRQVEMRLAAGAPPRPYTRERHAAWLRRQAKEQ